jgi:hypothetical protein
VEALEEAQGQIYQQIFIEIYAKASFAKLYDRKTPVTALSLNQQTIHPTQLFLR